MLACWSNSSSNYQSQFTVHQNTAIYIPSDIATTIIQLLIKTAWPIWPFYLNYLIYNSLPTAKVPRKLLSFQHAESRTQIKQYFAGAEKIQFGTLKSANKGGRQSGFKSEVKNRRLLKEEPKLYVAVYHLGNTVLRRANTGPFTGIFRFQTHAFDLKNIMFPTSKFLNIH